MGGRRQERIFPVTSSAARRMLIRTVVDRLPLRIRWELEVLEKLNVAPADLFERLTTILAVLVAQAFAVEEDEVAILLLRDRSLMLRFAHPVTLYCDRANIFPVNGSSIAGEVLRHLRGRIDNDLPQIRHLDFYERLCVQAARPWEIQKMVSTPLLIPWGHVLGVLQVSRKGNSVEEAGPNFSPVDLVKLTDLSRWLAPYLRKAIPSDF